MSYLQIGTLYAIREIGTTALEIPAGFLSDGLGRRRTMIACFVFYILSFLVFYRFTGYWYFMLAMLLFSLGEAFRTGTHKAMIFTYLQLKGWADQKVHYYGYTRSWSQMGSAISSLIAALIVFYSGKYRYIFLWTVFPYILNLILMISYPKVLDGEMKDLEGLSLYSKFRTLIQSFWLSFKDPVVLKAVNNFTLYDGFFKAVKDYLQPVLKTLALSLPFLTFLEEDKRSALLIGLVYFIIFLLTSYASSNAGRIAQRFPSLYRAMNITLIIGFILGITCGIWYQLGWPVLAVLSFVFIFLMENIRKPIGVAFIADRIDNQVMASVLSATSQIKSLWGAIIAVLLGFSIDWLGLGWALALVSLSLVAASPLIWLKSTRHHP